MLIVFVCIIVSETVINTFFKQNKKKTLLEECDGLQMKLLYRATKMSKGQ